MKQHLLFALKVTLYVYAIVTFTFAIALMKYTRRYVKNTNKYMMGTFMQTAVRNGAFQFHTDKQFRPSQKF